MSKLKDLLKACMTNAEAVRLAMAEPTLAAKAADADTDQAICLVNESIIDALELPRSERTAAQVALAKATDKASQVALHILGVHRGEAPSKLTLAGAKGLSLADAKRDLEHAARACTVDLAMPDDCLSVQGRMGWKVPKKSCKPHQRAWALIVAAERVES
jgi:hypothetical protein